MFETIGSLIDSLIPIAGGIFILTQLKKINKPFMKWIGIALIVVGLLLLAIDITELGK